MSISGSSKLLCFNSNMACRGVSACSNSSPFSVAILGEKVKICNPKKEGGKKFTFFFFTFLTIFLLFSQSAECSAVTREEYSQVQHHLGSLIDSIPRMKEAAGKYLETVGQIASDQKANTLILQQHAQIIEFLEIPQLLDTCVRNQYYEEALELEAHVQKLKLRLDTIPIVQNVAREVAQTMEMMVSELIQVLTTDIKLPQALKTVGFIKRMQLFSEVELRMVFLQARDVFLRTSLQGIPSTDTFNFASLPPLPPPPFSNFSRYPDPFLFFFLNLLNFQLKTYIEVCRVKFFDIITHYRAVFPDTLKDQRHQGNVVLYDWIVQKISDFMSVLELHLPRIVDGASLATLLNQSMSLGMSLGRIGVDFRGLLCRVFERAVLDLVTRVISTGTQAFLDSIRQYRWLLPQSPSMFSASAAASVATGATGLGLSDPPTPPVVLVDYAPIAILCNSYITAFNELRQCAPLSLVEPLGEAIKAALRQAAQDLGNYSASNRLKMKGQEREAFDDFCRVYGEVFVPFVVRGMQAVFPSHSELIYELIAQKDIAAPIESFYENLKPRVGAPVWFS